MQIVKLLNGIDTVHQDHDLSSYFDAIASGGVYRGLTAADVSGGVVVSSGRAIIPCTRTTGEKICAVFVNTEDVTLTKSAGWIVIEVAQVNIDNKFVNNEQGSGIGSIKIVDTLPTKNCVILGKIEGTSVVATDRQHVSVSGSIIDTIVVDKLRDADGNPINLATQEWTITKIAEASAISSLTDNLIAGEDVAKDAPVFRGTGNEKKTVTQAVQVGKTSTSTTIPLSTSTVSPYCRSVTLTATKVGNPDNLKYGSVSIQSGQSTLIIDKVDTNIILTTAGSSPSNYWDVTINEVERGFDPAKRWKSGAGERNHFSGVSQATVTTGQPLIATTLGQHELTSGHNLSSGEVYDRQGSLSNKPSEVYVGQLQGDVLNVGEQRSFSLGFVAGGGSVLVHHNAMERSASVDGNYATGHVVDIHTMTFHSAYTGTMKLSVDVFSATAINNICASINGVKKIDRRIVSTQQNQRHDNQGAIIDVKEGSNELKFYMVIESDGYGPRTGKVRNIKLNYDQIGPIYNICKF